VWARYEKWVRGPPASAYAGTAHLVSGTGTIVLERCRVVRGCVGVVDRVLEAIEEEI
jgi:hypothetical protein